MDMDVGNALILGSVGWDWISSRDMRLLYVDGRVSLRRGLRNFSWTSCPPGPASHRVRCRFSATGSFASSSARSSG